jgi:hypothetical protein
MMEVIAQTQAFTRSETLSLIDRNAGTGKQFSSASREESSGGKRRPPFENHVAGMTASLEPFPK